MSMNWNSIYIFEIKHFGRRAAYWGILVYTFLASNMKKQFIWFCYTFTPVIIFITANRVYFSSISVSVWDMITTVIRFIYYCIKTIYSFSPILSHLKVADLYPAVPGQTLRIIQLSLILSLVWEEISQSHPEFLSNSPTPPSLHSGSKVLKWWVCVWKQWGFSHPVDVCALFQLDADTKH